MLTEIDYKYYIIFKKVFYYIYINYLMILSIINIK